MGLRAAWRGVASGYAMRGGGMSWESDRQATLAHRAKLRYARTQRTTRSAKTREGWEDESSVDAMAASNGLYSRIMPSAKMYGKEATQ